MNLEKDVAEIRGIVVAMSERLARVEGAIAHMDERLAEATQRMGRFEDNTDQRMSRFEDTITQRMGRVEDHLQELRKEVRQIPWMVLGAVVIVLVAIFFK